MIGALTRPGVAVIVALALLSAAGASDQCGITETVCGAGCCKLTEDCINGVCCSMMNSCGTTCCTDDQTCSNKAAGECRNRDGSIAADSSSAAATPGGSSSSTATTTSAPSCGITEEPCGDTCCGLTDTCDHARGLCCPINSDQCGGVCCAPGQNCADEASALCCPITSTACGGECCGIGSTCFQGRCCGAVCGDTCCEEGSYCKTAALGQCAPVPEGSFPCQKRYCQYGQTCVYTTNCVNEVCTNENFCCDAAYCGGKCCPADAPACSADGSCIAATEEQQN